MVNQDCRKQAVDTEPDMKSTTTVQDIVNWLTDFTPTLRGPSHVAVNGLSMNSKTVQKADLYAAVAGAKFHGADFWQSASDSGAVAVLTDPHGAQKIPEEIPCIIVDDVRGALAQAAALIFQNVESQQPKLYGVTGTNGKTTTTFFLETLLSKLSYTTGLIGTIEIRVAGKNWPSEFTTPEAPALHQLVAQMRDAGVEATAMEVSSHAMSYKRNHGLQFAVVGFTNLTQDHLDLHGSMDEYFDAKAELFTSEHSQRQVITLNGGTEPQWGQRLARQTPNAITLDLGPASDLQETSVEFPATWRVNSVSPEALGHRFSLIHESGWTVETSVGLPGLFNVANAALAAVMTLTAHGQEQWDEIRTVLESATVQPFSSAVPGRMEVVSAQPTTVVDFAHNPEGLREALDAVRQVQQATSDTGRLIVVFGATGDRDTGKRPIMGGIATELADVIIISDDDPHYEDPAEIREAVLKGAEHYKKQHGGEQSILEIAPRAKALEYAVSIAQPQDTILAAGRGHETHQDFAGTPIQLDDRQVLRQALAQRGFSVLSTEVQNESQ